MHIRPLLASAALTIATLGAGAAALPSGAGAASPVQLRFANSSPYEFTSTQTLGFCVDGMFYGDVTASSLSAPVSVTPGAHAFTILNDSSGNCATGSVDTNGTLTVPDVASATLIINNGNAVEGSPLQILPDDLSCPAAGQGRLIVRNGARVSGPNTGSIDFFGAIGSAVPTALVKDVSMTGQGSTDLASGTYGKVRSGATGIAYADADEIQPATFDIQAGKVTIAFLAGGWDGSSGFYTETLDANCAATPTTVPMTTPTTAPTSTTVPAKVAPAATPVNTQPTYTG